MKAQHQGSLLDQLRELVGLANKDGLYDAADFLTDYINDREKKHKGGTAHAPKEPRRKAV